MPVTFQKIQIFVVLLLLVRCPIAARANEPITVIYGRGRESLMNLTMNGQSQLEKGDFAAAQQSLDAVIKADPTFYPAHYIRAEVFLDQRKYQEAIQDCNEALRKDSTFAEGLCAPSGAALRFHANGSGQNVRVAHRPQACVPCRLDGPRSDLDCQPSSDPKE